MIRTRCIGETNLGQCKTVFRSRVKHKHCREHFSFINHKPRPIASRELSENKYRRTRSRKGFVVKKVIVQKSKSNKSKSHESY